MLFQDGEAFNIQSLRLWAKELMDPKGSQLILRARMETFYSWVFAKTSSGSGRLIAQAEISSEENATSIHPEKANATS